MKRIVVIIGLSVFSLLAACANMEQSKTKAASESGELPYVVKNLEDIKRDEAKPYVIDKRTGCLYSLRKVKTGSGFDQETLMVPVGSQYPGEIVGCKYSKESVEQYFDL